MWSWLTRPLRTGADRPSFLLDAGQLEDRLHHERLRADRSGKPVALVTFTLHHTTTLDRARAELAAILKLRLRATDVAGQLAANRIAAVLPETASHGAWTLADDVHRLFRKSEATLGCHVSIYPTPESDADQTDARGEHPPRRVEPSRPVEPLAALFIRHTPPLKRALDIAGAIVGLVLLAPLMLITAAAVKLSSPGPVFFRQRRDGLGGRPFTLIKFRTMYVDAEARKAALRQFSEQDGPAFKMKNDPRITPIGRFLRKTCVDELPQLWNVLKGEMSLVGPRPLPCDESGQCRGWERRRLDVTPGLTCIWQVEGKSRVTFAEWMRMDIRYIRGRSLLADLRLIARTCLAVVFAKGSH